MVYKSKVQKAAEQHSRFLQKVSEEAAQTVSQINPKIGSVKVKVTRLFPNGLIKEVLIDSTYDSADKCILRIKCPNTECPNHFIDLSSILYKTVKESKDSTRLAITAAQYYESRSTLRRSFSRTYCGGRRNARRVGRQNGTCGHKVG